MDACIILSEYKGWKLNFRPCLPFTYLFHRHQLFESIVFALVILLSYLSFFSYLISNICVLYAHTLMVSGIIFRVTTEKLGSAEGGHSWVAPCLYNTVISCGYLYDEISVYIFLITEENLLNEIN